MNKIYPLLLLCLSVLTLSCSKDENHPTMVSNQELVIGNWRLIEVISVNAMGTSNTEDFSKTVLHVLAFHNDGNLTTTIQPLNEDQSPNGEAQLIAGSYTVSEDGKHISIANHNRINADIIRLGKTDFIYKTNLSVTTTSEYHLKRIN